jgi:4-amino-4-deoxy-L-arabinose transferase-like glycosyltransferase
MAENRSFSVTEAFFDLKPRYPHAIKTIFHALQILFIRIMGYEIFSVRLISLLFGALTLIFFYRLCKLFFNSEKLALAISVLLSADIQFIYASHFARQEIILLFVLIFALYYFLSRIDHVKTIHHIMLGCIIGLSIGIHPNSFIISIPFVLIYLYHIFASKKLSYKGLILYITTVSIFAAMFILLSLYFDPDFITHYSGYGNEFEVFNPLSSKIAEMAYFYKKLYYGVSGTYYTPDIRFQFFLFPIVMILSAVKVIAAKDSDRKNQIAAILLSIFAVNAGIILIGRYNQTSVVLQFPMFYILIGYLLVDSDNIKFAFKKTAFILLFFFLSASSVYNVLPYLDTSYDNYLNEISKAVNKDDNVLANLNTEFYFENGRLHDYRNLAYLQDKGISFGQYIRENKIKYIIYPEEMDLIYELRPKWNGVYGTPVYYDEMKNFLKNDCLLVYEFTDKTYGIRIAQYINQKDWTVKIFMVLD